MPGIGRSLIVVGVVLVVVGLALTVAPRIPWLGRLPGDFSYESERLRIHFPLATSLLLSAVVSLLLYIFRR